MTKKNKRIDEDFLGDLTTQARKIAGAPIIKSLTSIFYGDEPDKSVDAIAPSLGARPEKQLGSPASEPGSFSADDAYSDLPDQPQTSYSITSLFNKVKDYVEDLLTEKIPLKDALKANPRKRALIVGSSQAGVMGPTVMRMLETRGFVDFKFIPEPSRTMTSIYSTVAAVVPDKSMYDVIIIYPGYRQGEDPDSTGRLISLFEPARCFVVIPPPVTEITNTYKAARLGLNKNKPVPPDYWFKLSGESYAARRESYCEMLKTVVESSGATFIDPRDVVTGGAMQKSGVSYPNMEDGIHPSEEISAKISQTLVEKIFTCELLVSAGDVVKKIKPEDLERNPALASHLKDYPATSAVLSAAAAKITRGVGLKDDPVYIGQEENHQGLDIGVPVGTPVVAALDGVVGLIGVNHKDAGNYVEIKHPNGDLTRYLHLSEIKVDRVGQPVSKGQVIGLSGGAKGAYGSGKSTGPHLHWETWHGPFRHGTLIDPLVWLDSNPTAVKPVNFA